MHTDLLANIRRKDQIGVGKIILKRYNHITYEAGNMADLYEYGQGPLSEAAGDYQHLEKCCYIIILN
jgi:hypothetical protein